MTDHNDNGGMSSDDGTSTAREYPRENAFLGYVHSVRHDEPPTRSPRPWLLAALTVACALVVIVGSFGPWMYYETVSNTPAEVDVRTEYGVRTDGAFSLLFAAVAIVALGIALFRRDADWVAWIAVVALALCALIGLYDWMIFEPLERSLESGEVGEIVRVEWGVKVVGLAGTAGAVASFFAARAMNRD